MRAVSTGAEAMETVPGTGAVDPLAAFAAAAAAKARTVAVAGDPRSEYVR